MARIIRIKSDKDTRHLYWRFNRFRFVTCCDDVNVILDGHVMSLSEATSILLRDEGIPPSFFWE